MGFFSVGHKQTYVVFVFVFSNSMHKSPSPDVIIKSSQGCNIIIISFLRAFTILMDLNCLSVGHRSIYFVSLTSFVINCLELETMWVPFNLFSNSTYQSPNPDVIIKASSNFPLNHVRKERDDELAITKAVEKSTASARDLLRIASQTDSGSPVLLPVKSNTVESPVNLPVKCNLFIYG